MGSLRGDILWNVE
jgi:hypothetical protein